MIAAKWWWPFTPFGQMFLVDHLYHPDRTMRFIITTAALIMCGIWLVIIKPWWDPAKLERQLEQELG